jgi:hypothetical protein
MVAVLAALLACSNAPSSSSAPPPADAHSTPVAPATPPATPVEDGPTSKPSTYGEMVNGERVEYTALGVVKGVNVVGEWTSRCPHHGYARNLHVVSGGRWYGTDIATVCEPGKECIWNGLVVLTGTWGKVEDKLVLRTMNQRPSSFVSTEAGELVEDETKCTYTRGVTVPPGYTREQVQADVPVTDNGTEGGQPPSVTPPPATAAPAAPAGATR